MIRTIRSEFIKFRTITMNWVLGIVALAFPVVITLLSSWFQGDNGDFTGRNLVELVAGTSYVTVLLVMVLSATHMTNEYGFGTVRPTFAATPRRGRVIAAKAIVLVVFAALLQIVVVAVCVFGGRALAQHRGATIDLGSAANGGVDLIAPLVGVLVLTVFAALLGLGVGMLMRSTPLSITTLVLWPLLVEGLLSGLIFVITKNEKSTFWLPFRAGLRLAMVGGVGMGSDAGPSRLQAGLYFGSVSVALTLLGAWAVRRRDA